MLIYCGYFDSSDDEKSLSEWELSPLLAYKYAASTFSIRFPIELFKGSIDLFLAF